MKEEFKGGIDKENNLENRIKRADMKKKKKLKER